MVVFFVLLQISSLHHTLAGLYEQSAAMGGLGKPSGENVFGYSQSQQNGASPDYKHSL